MRKPNRLLASLLLAACGGGSETGVDVDAFSPAPLCPWGWSCFTVTNTNDTGAGSLGQAITDANARAGLDRILFSIPGVGPHVINTDGYFVTDPIYIDGYSEPDASRATDTAPAEISVVLEALTNISTGITLSTDDSVVTGLALRGYGAPLGIGAAISVLGSDNVVKGCYIGTDHTGTVRSPNNVGVSIAGLRHVVGGLTVAARNVIGGSEVAGVDSFSCSECRIIGNHIGTDPGSTIDLGNSIGVQVDNTAIVIGGVEPGARNVISGNGTGIQLNGDNHRVEGNYIGTNAAGTGGGFSLLNGTGIVIPVGSSGNVIGGTAAGAGNLISNSTSYGIGILGHQNRVEGNLIGTDTAGAAALGNGTGIAVFGLQNAIGASSVAARNVISGNDNQGVMIVPFFGAASPSGNLVQGNFIGVDATGTAPLGNGEEGVWVQNGVLNLIGGLGAGAGNTIGGNGGDGILIEELGALPSLTNTVQGNHIGTDAAGILDLGNGGSGVDVIGGLNHWIGGTLAGQGNRIAHNALDGVTIESGTGHGVLGNSIWSNGGLSIDLGPNGWTANDGLGDPDTGANALQNRPQIDSVSSGVGTATIDWSLETTASVQVRVELYASTSCTTAKRGDAQRHLGSAVVTTDATGFASGQATYSGVASGEWITATATEILGPIGRNTSELSRCVLVP